ncbi:unnamed protein product, partial [Ascophyllum nodosum]
NKIIKEDSALHCGRQRSPQTLETRIGGVVEPSIVKKQRPEPGCMTKEEVYR